MINDNLFLNDLFRLGGLNSLRGFNENFFYASDYFTGTLETRMYIGEYSNIFAFYDQGYVYYNLGQSNNEDTPFGIGLGMNLATNAGVLRLVFALGKSNSQSLDFKFSKIHVGYFATF
jgi:hemolysin activation/secretion protein